MTSSGKGKEGYAYFQVYASQKSKSPASDVMRGFHMGCLTVTYFHTGFGTIIGARAFHGPVRDGKGWDRPAMAVRH